MIEKILFMTLSNIGDVVLTLPVLDLLRANFPEARITVLSGPRAKEIFENNPGVSRLIVYDKHSRLKEKIKLFFALKRQSFDLVIDLRNSFLGFALFAKRKTSFFRIIPRNIAHMKDRHLYKIKDRRLKIKIEQAERKSLYISPENEGAAEKLLKENNINLLEPLIVISPGARSSSKRWPKEKFVVLAGKLLNEFKAKIILAGDASDSPIADFIASGFMPEAVVNLAGKTRLLELACLLKKSRLVIGNDSAVLHLASYLNVPVVGIFGITSEEKYGPWPQDSAVLKRDIFCRPCQKAQCRFGTLKCIKLIKVEDVLRQVRNIFTKRYPLNAIRPQYDFKRILIARTDRIGDLLLSTPVIKAMRDNYPNAYIAVMASPYAREIVEGNPYLDEVIIYDKDKKHKSWQRSIKFALNLKKFKFDLALILHPTNRMHLITFLAGIRRRIGYNRKFDFLLTDRIEHAKEQGRKHESEYALDFVRYLGIEPKDAPIFMPLKEDSEKWADDLFANEGINREDKLLAIQPAASCPSKVWPSERFAFVAGQLALKYGFKVLVLSGVKDIKISQAVASQIKVPVINLAGKTSVSQLASLLKRCSLFISNDSGPAHIASALGVPVVSIFGRDQAGLSPKRWGPLGLKDKILHKKIGCIECLAHNCTKGFLCLKAITVDDVVSAADEILKSYRLKTQ